MFCLIRVLKSYIDYQGSFKHEYDMNKTDAARKKLMTKEGPLNDYVSFDIRVSASSCSLFFLKMNVFGKFWPHDKYEETLGQAMFQSKCHLYTWKGVSA